MSRIESKVVTIKCNRFGCEKEQVYVNVGKVFETDEQWTDGTFDGTKFDLCPEHDEELRDFFYGTEDIDEIEKQHRSDMEPN